MTNLERLKTYLDTAEIVEFTNENIDKEYTKLPKDLTILSTSDISKYLNATVQQRVYVRTLVSRARAVYRELKSEYDKERCRVFAQTPPKMSVTEKELRVYSDEGAAECKRDMEYALERYDYMKDILDSYEDITFILSRELSRRLKDVEDNNRNSKFNV